MGHSQSKGYAPLSTNNTKEKEKEPPSFNKLTCCEQWVSGLSVFFWAFYCLLGLAIMQNSLKLASKEKSFFYHEPMSTMSEAWQFIFLSIMGIYNALREALIAVEHRLTLIVTEIIQFLLYLTAAATLYTGPWTIDNDPLNSPMMRSVSQVLMLLSVVLGILHVIVGIMRPSWRAEAAKIEVAMSTS